MPNLTAEKDAIDVQSREDVEALLQEMFDYKREAMQREQEVKDATAGLREKKQEIEESIEEIEAEHADFIERRQEAIRKRKEVIAQWAEEHPDDVIGDVDGRTWSTTWGELSFKRVPFNFDWTDKEAVIEALKEMGRGELVRVEERVPYKSTLKDEPGLVRRLDGVEAQEEHDRVSVELAIG